MNVSVDGHVHELVEDEHTACGLVVPHGTPWDPSPVNCPVELGETEDKPATKRKATKKK